MHLPEFLVRFTLVATVLLPGSALAAGVVGDGTAASCTETALEAALAGGGSVTFNCGPGLAQILITSSKTITADTTIDGGETLEFKTTVLTSQIGVRIFDILNASVTLEDIALVGGYLEGAPAVVDNGGAILQSGGALTIRNSDFVSSRAAQSGGAIYNLFGTLDISDSRFVANDAATFGGALFTTGAVTIARTQFVGNKSETSGAIHVSSGAVRIDSGEFVGNEATFFGGVAYNSGTLTVTNSSFTGNGAGDGGGVFYNSGTLIVANTSFTANTAEDRGGVFYNSGTLVVTNSTSLVNSAENGGGSVYNASTATFTNDTFIVDSAEADDSRGGTILNAGAMTMTNCTIVLGDAGTGGNLFNDVGGTLTLRNSIVYLGSEENCSGTIVDGGHNIDGGVTCGFDPEKGSKIDTDPGLDPAGPVENGGPTATWGLCVSEGAPAECTGVSPAFRAGDQEVCAKVTGAAPVANRDQRGFTRPGEGATACSIGAFEPNGIESLCGNYTLDDGEECDDGFWPWTDGEPCSAVCTTLECGDTNDSHSITASDALFTLKTAVQTAKCDLAVCDVNDDGSINASDALRVLRRAVDPEVTLTCA